MKVDLRGYPVWWHRWLEAWWIITGKWSLHRAWQAGKDRGHLDEMMRTAVLRPQHSRDMVEKHEQYQRATN